MCVTLAVQSSYLVVSVCATSSHIPLRMRADSCCEQNDNCGAGSLAQHLTNNPVRIDESYKLLGICSVFEIPGKKRGRARAPYLIVVAARVIRNRQ